MAFIMPVYYTVQTFDEFDNAQADAWWSRIVAERPHNIKAEAEARAEREAAQSVFYGDKLFGELPVMPDLSTPSVIPAARVHMKRYKPAYARNSDTFVKRGGTMHGTTQVVTSGNGVGVVPQAFREPGPSNAEWLAIRYR